MDYSIILFEAMLNILARSYKIFTKEEVLKPFFNRPHKNLYEMAYNHESKGVGLRFFRKTWPSDSYYTVTKIRFDDIRHGKAWGVLTWKGKTAEKPEEIRSPLKLGIWRYSDNPNT